MLNRTLPIALLCLSVSASAAFSQVRVTSVGDSITLGYSVYDDPGITSTDMTPLYTSTYYNDTLPGSGGGLQLAFNAAGLNATVRARAYGGFTLAKYSNTHTRAIVDPAGNPVSVGVNLHDEVLATDPDVVFFMLGSNDSASWVPGGANQAFHDAMTAAFQSLASYTNGRGQHPEVFIGLPPPILTDGKYVAGWTQQQLDYNRTCATALRDEIIPALRTAALDFNFNIVDIYSAFSANPDLESLYSDKVHPDQLGRNIIRQEFVDAYIAAPEPATLALLLAGAVAVLRRRPA